MMLLTQKIKAALPKLYATEHLPLAERIVICKFFSPYSNWTWYVFEGEWYPEDKDFLFFGFVQGFENELGYFALSELKSAHSPSALTIERDRSIFKVPFKQLVEPHVYSYAA